MQGPWGNLGSAGAPCRCGQASLFPALLRPVAGTCCHCLPRAGLQLPHAWCAPAGTQPVTARHPEPTLTDPRGKVAPPRQVWSLVPVTHSLPHVAVTSVCPQGHHAPRHPTEGWHPVWGPSPEAPARSWVWPQEVPAWLKGGQGLPLRRQPGPQPGMAPVWSYQAPPSPRAAPGTSSPCSTAHHPRSPQRPAGLVT